MKRTKENTILLPKYDISFKTLFKSAESQPVAEGFLKAMLGLPLEESLGNIQVKDPELLPLAEDEKLSIVDAFFELPGGEKVIVEMQLCRFPEIKEQLIHKWARVAAGQLARGQRYGDFRRVVLVAVLEHNIIDDPYYIHRYGLLDEVRHSRFTDLMSFVMIELKKLPDKPDAPEQTAAWLWAKFFASETEEEMAELAKEDKGIEQARMILVKLSEDENAQYWAEHKEEQWRIEMSIRDGARREGLAEGETKGREKERLANAARMKADGMDIVLIEKYTGLSQGEIERL